MSKSKTRVLSVLVGGFIAIGLGHSAPEPAVAQGRKPVVITRIFTGPDGLAHAKDIELNMNARGVTEMFEATGASSACGLPHRERTDKPRPVPRMRPDGTPAPRASS